MTNTVTVTESNNSVTVTEQNNTVSILEDAPIVTPEPWYADLTTLPTTSGTATVTADSTPHSKGAWTEIIASNAAETSVLFVEVTGISISGQNTATMIDVATGASGSESAIAENIAVGAASRIYFEIPIRIAAGARISVRSQAAIASDTATIELGTFVMGDVTAVPTTVDVLGTDVATSAGTELATSYTEVVAATSQDYAAIVIVESLAGSSAQDEASIVVGVGSAGAETDIAQKEFRSSFSEAMVTYPWVGSVTEVGIGSGSRLAAKKTSATAWVTLIGVPPT